MSNLSPQIVFNEFDNTAYSNPKSVSGTTVCIIGYARKGVIGTPVEITSYKNFVSTFGKPVDGYYSGLAVRNVLNAGGKVLFVRVADSTAETSNVIVKNAVEAKNGKVLFDRNSDILIGTEGYEVKSIYGVNVTNTEGASKDIYLRSPTAGKFTQASIVEQLTAGLSATPGYYEVLKRNTLRDGVYSFDIKVNDVLPEGSNGYYIETSMSDSGQTLAEKLGKAIKDYGQNSYCVLEMSDDPDFEQTGTFSDDKTFAISGERKFKIVKGTGETDVTVNITSGSTLKTIASVINNAIEAFQVKCLYVSATESSNPKLLFVNNSGSTGDISIKSSGTIESASEIFVTNNVTEGASNIEGIAPKAADSQFGLYVKTLNGKSTGEARTDVSVEYNEDTQSVVFVGTEVGEGKKVEIVPATYGNFIFDAENGANVGQVLGCFLGTDEITGLNIARDADTRKVYIESDGKIQYPTVADSSKQGVLSLINIEKDIKSDTSIGYTYITGQAAIPANERDMVVITSKEKGSATNNIAVEFYSSTSPLNGEIKHDITVFVDGVKKEFYEDVSYNYSDVEKRFDTIINQVEDNGGSAYITMKVEKNDYSSVDVEVADGTYTVGAPINENSIKRTPDIDVNAYNEYDYSVGTDGIPEDGGDELFEAAMETEYSPLSDKDLYNFHVLITPDNISEVVQTAAIKICETRNDAMAIIDPPVGLSKKAVIDWHNGKGYGRSSALSSTYAATYWPWCKVFDTNAGKNIWVMPSVVMAAKYVTVDRTAGSWYAPAGETNGVMSVIDIEQYPNVNDRNELYVDYNRVNPFIKLGDGSIVCYGEKTLQRINSVLTKIHTRRMLIQIKKEAKEALRGYIFMPNVSENLSKITSNLTAIFEKYKVGGGLSYYKIVCDETNNPIEVRQQDIINVDVACVPEGCLELITINLTMNKSAETVSVN